MPETPKPEKWMTGSSPTSLPSLPELRLASQLEDLTRVRPWAEALAARYSVPPETQFAIELCLEEALSNIIRHGYQGQANQAISIACTVERAPTSVENEGAGELVFTVEDHAPAFDPLAPIAAPASAHAVNSQVDNSGDFLPGGQGLRLLRRFASRLAWQQLPNGNRLILAFAIPPHANP
jgi:anti-sigma regulatory factor (Ser/Thr protein kinase)